MDDFSPIKTYPAVTASLQWAHEVLSDPRLVRAWGNMPRYYDEPFLHQYQASVADYTDGKTTTPGGSATGVSFSRSVALMKVAGEAVERGAVVSTVDERLGFGSFAEHSPELDPELFQFFSPEQLATEPFRGFRWTDAGRFYWTPGQDVLTERAVNLPAQLVYTPLRNDSAQPEECLFHTTTTGAACGQSEEESTVTAMLEILERDAFLVHYLSRTPGMRIDFSAHPLFTEIERYLARFQLKLTTWLLPTDFPVTTVLACITDEAVEGIPTPWLSTGLKCSFDPVRAIIGAIEEACQGRPWVRGLLEEIHLRERRLEELVSEELIADRGIFWSDRGRRSDLSFLLESNRTVSVDQVVASANADWRMCATELLDFCRQRNHPVYRADLTTPAIREHGLFVTRVLMPTVQQFYLVEPHIPLRVNRWQTIPVELGLQPVKPALPNETPHFFL